MLLTEKAILYDQLLASAKQLVNRDDIILKNEQEIIKLRYEIDIGRLEVFQKRELVVELEAELEAEKARYKELKVEINRLEKKADQLKQVLRQKEDELDQLEEIIRDRDAVIEELERLIGDRADVQSIHSSVSSKRPKKPIGWYRPIKGDLVDELIARHFNALRSAIPVKRLGDGNYVFGTKKIYVKLL